MLEKEVRPGEKEGEDVVTKKGNMGAGGMDRGGEKRRKGKFQPQHSVDICLSMTGRREKEGGMAEKSHVV